MPRINPKILRWARKTAGLTPDEAVKKLAINDARGINALDRLAALETGETIPSRPLLVKMAKLYRRPLLTFYLPSIPLKGERGEDFRTFPEPVSESESALVDALVRDVRARQALMRSALEATDEAQPVPFIGSVKREEGITSVVEAIEGTLGFDREAFRRKKPAHEAFAYLRGLTEAAGIFVLLLDNLGSWHTTIDPELFRGFALADDIAPLVAINANDSPSAWSFTLVHELAHLWLGATGVSGGMAERAVEKFSNDVASELLVPNAELGIFVISEEMPLEDAMTRISDFATDRNVSSTMVAYKLYRSGKFNFDHYQKIKTAYRKLFLDRKAAERARARGKSSGPSYHVVRKHRVGSSLIRFVERMMKEQNLSTTEAGKVLGVGAHNVHALIEQARPNHIS